MPGPSDVSVTDRRLPAFVLTGYLGAGKTTLVNHILSRDHGRRYAVLVNEFGEIGIDNDLIVDSREELFELNNGCICCTVRGDLIRTLRNLVKNTDSGSLDGIVIETTGLADPGPIIQTFFVDQILMAQVRLDSVTTVVDAHHIRHQLETSREAAEQVGFADQILLNKIDLAAGELAAIEGQLRHLNGHAPIHRVERAEIDLSAVLGRGGFDLQRIAAANIDHGPSETHNHVNDADCADDGHVGHIHAAGIGSVSLRIDHPIDAAGLENWLEDLLQRRGQDILRTKGIFDIAGENRKWVFQSVHMLLDGDFRQSWRAGEARASRMIFIGRDLDKGELQQGLNACMAPH